MKNKNTDTIQKEARKMWAKLVSENKGNSTIIAVKGWLFIDKLITKIHNQTRKEIIEEVKEKLWSKEVVDYFEGGDGWDYKRTKKYLNETIDKLK